ncbi:hypothetical protein MOQ_006339 [Trypanosoma cruzi marinkellei]|uniref:Uncharacterized protein n=1 Tax=Trypanosoma cruzi marinkellei TaxID=85056 RepID=K2MVV9_TRYCR|nr:hypothetical protein MOQ_006339 [Trypanosoma cruzi marinkellei]
MAVLFNTLSAIFACWYPSFFFVVVVLILLALGAYALRSHSALWSCGDGEKNDVASRHICLSFAPLLCMSVTFSHPLVVVLFLLFWLFLRIACSWSGTHNAAIYRRRCVGVSLLQSDSARPIGIIIIAAALFVVVVLRIWHPQRTSCHVAAFQSQLHPRGKPQACRDVSCEAISPSDATKDGRTGDCGGVGSRKESNASLPGNCRHRPCDSCLVEVRCVSTFFFDECRKTCCAWRRLPSLRGCQGSGR